MIPRSTIDPSWEWGLSLVGYGRSDLVWPVARASLRAAEGVDLRRASIRSPFMKLLKLPLIQAFEIMFAHTRRHIWLMREVLGSPDFPSERRG